MTSRRSILRGTAGAVVGSTLLSTGVSGTPPAYTVGSDLTDPVDVSVPELDRAIAAVEPGSPLIGLSSAALSVQDNRGINAIYQVAHAAHESAWGCSQIARKKNNLFGWRAFDDCPSSCADTFESYEASVFQVMEFIDNRYLTEGGEFYEGPTLGAMNVNYATDPNWDSKIARKMNELAEAIDQDATVGPGSPEFTEDDYVKATVDVPVKATTQSTDSNVVDTRPRGSRGRLAEGPYEENGVTYWWIEWENGQLGWSAQRYLTVTDRVRSTETVNVRSTAEISASNVQFTQPAGVLGTVANGPYENDGFTWWWVEWENDFGGWSPESKLSVVDESAETDPAFEIGQEVGATTCLASRSNPGWASSREGVVTDGDTGFVKNGYVTEDGRQWWEIDWRGGPRGWSDATFLEAPDGATGQPRGAERLDGFVWPVSGDVTSEWGENRVDYVHYALDIGAPFGRLTRTPAPGRVVALTTEGAGGNSVFIDHGGDYVSEYHHFQEFRTSEGELVERGDVIGEIGSTGASTGPHLHFEIVKDGANLFIPGLEGEEVVQGERIPLGETVSGGSAARGDRTALGEEQ